MKKDSEFGLLCCIARNNVVIAECESEGLTASDFSDPTYRYMYGHVYKLWQDNIGVDEVTLRTNATGLGKLLKDSGVTEKVFYDRLFGGTPVDTSNAGVFVKDIMEDSMQRILSEGVDSIKTRMGKMSSSEIIAALEDMAQGAHKRFMMEKPVLIGGGSGLFKQIESREERQLAGLPLPWAHINERISGLPPGTTTLWIAPTGTGKSAAMTNIMDKTCYKDKEHALLIGVEMPEEVMMLRQVACRSGVTERDLRLNRNWRANEQRRKAVEKACEQIEMAQTTIARMGAVYEEFKEESHSDYLRNIYAILEVARTLLQEFAGDQ